MPFGLAKTAPDGARFTVIVPLPNPVALMFSVDEPLLSSP